MSPPEPETKHLQCPGCGEEFRITPREGRRLPPAVPCPTCETDIPTDRPTGEGFWVSKSRAEIFDRRPVEPPTGPSERDEPVRTPESDEASAPSGAARREERQFRDVSELRSERQTLLGGDDEEAGPGAGSVSKRDAPEGPPDREEPSGEVLDDRDESKADGSEEPSEAPFDSYEREPPAANLDEVASDLEFVAAEVAENVTGTPLPLPVHGEEEQTAAEPPGAAEEQSAPSASAEQPSGGEADSTEPPPASELATMQFAEWEEELTGRVADREYDVRIHDTVRESLSLREVVEMLEEGVWTGAVEIREGEEWLTLAEHPLFEELRDYLVGQSRQILLRAEPPGGPRPESGTSAGEPAPPEESPAARAAERDGTSDEDAEHAAASRGETSERASEAPPEVQAAAETAELEAAEASPAEAVEEQGGAGRWTVAAVAVWGLAIAVVAVVWYLPGSEEGSESMTAWNLLRPEREAASRDEEDAGALSFSTDVEIRPPAGTVGEALRAARSAVDAASSAETKARAYLRTERYLRARRHVVRAMADRGLEAELQGLYDRSVREDESLRPPTETIGDDVEIDAIHALGGGWSVSFRMTRDGESAFAFKPAQKHWERGWRAEIAAYRFCKIAICHFEVPRNRPARISRERFERLYDRVGGEDQRAYRENFDELVWRKEAGPDGEVREYLYGTLKDWVPEFVKWPIEYQTVWKPWLNGDHRARVLEKPLEQVLKPLRERGPIDFYENILEERGDATTRSMARGLSSILTFDYLTSNWDRFSTAEKFYGVNNQFADGRFVSIDNGAAFYPHHKDTVERRFKPVTRFSRTMVASIRALRPAIANPVLFPNPTSSENRRLAVFWEQHDRFVRRINMLVAEHGKRSIYAFR